MTFPRAKYSNTLGVPLNPPLQKSGPSLQQQTINMLSEKVDKLEAALSHAKVTIRQLDGDLLSAKRTARAAEEDARACLDALSHVAAEVTNDTRAGRRARETARQLLEARGVHVPTSLGRSRKRLTSKSTDP